jgi:hypothetical protein
LIGRASRLCVWTVERLTSACVKPPSGSLACPVWPPRGRPLRVSSTDLAEPGRQRQGEHFARGHASSPTTALMSESSLHLQEDVVCQRVGVLIGVAVVGIALVLALVNTNCHTVADTVAAIYMHICVCIFLYIYIYMYGLPQVLGTFECFFIAWPTLYL